MDTGARRVTGADITMDIIIVITMAIARATGQGIMQGIEIAPAGLLTIILKTGHQIMYTRIVHRG